MSLTPEEKLARLRRMLAEVNRKRKAAEEEAVWILRDIQALRRKYKI